MKKQEATVLVEVPREDAQVWASFRLTADTRYTRLARACKAALGKEA